MPDRFHRRVNHLDTTYIYMHVTTLRESREKKNLGRKARNRALRQDNMREALANRKLEHHVIDTIEKFDNPDLELDPAMVNRMKAAAELRLRLIDKYLPSLKAVEVQNTGETNLASLLVEAARVAKLLQDQQVKQEKDITEPKPAIDHQSMQ